MDKKEIAKEKAMAAYRRINNAYNQSRKDLENVLDSLGGFVKTLPCHDKPNILVNMYDQSDNEYTELVFGIRLIKGEGIFICTTSSVENYEYDNGVSFGYLYDFEDGTEDKENIEKLLADPGYYIDIDQDIVDTRQIVYEILASIDCYI